MPPSRRPPTPAQTLRRSTLALLAFWLLVAGVGAGLCGSVAGLASLFSYP